MRFHFKKFISVKEWQKIQDNFSTITGLSLQTFDSEGNPVTKPSSLPRICTKIAKDSILKNTLCDKCLPTFLGGSAVVDKNLGYICPIEGMGIYNFIVPLSLKQTTVGYVQIGPLILVMRQSKEEYRQTAQRLNLDLEILWDAILEIRVISYQGAQSLIEFIREIGEYVIQLAHKNILIRKKESFTQEVTKFIRLFDVLLEVAFEISKADIGSVMFLDKDNNLTIHASKGIAEEIVKKTNVRLGEGISGIVAKEGSPFLIDDTIQDNRIKRYLMRSDIISSSMVLPLMLRNQILGVMNLGLLKISPTRFTPEDVNSIQKLIELTAVASQQ